MRAAVYARVSTVDQEPENQLTELRRYIEARGWSATEYVDRGESGAKDRRPALDRLVADARARRVDAVVIWDLSRLGRSLGHLVRLIEDWQSSGVSLVSMRDGLDLGTASGRLQFHVLAALATFERDRLRERVHAGLRRARAQGKRLGRPKARVPIERVQKVASMPVDRAAQALGVSRSTLKRWRRQVQQTPQL